MLSGVGALVRKELQALLREPKSAFMIFFPVVIFLTVFVFATTKDVSNSSIVIYNMDHGKHSADLIYKIINTEVFKESHHVYSMDAFNDLIKTEKSFIGIVFPKDFSKKIKTGKTSNIQIITDGRRTNTAVIARGYISQIIAGKQASMVNTRTLYNPNKEPIWFSITNLICMIVVSQTISIVAISISREKEEGTFDQLLVSPIKPLGMLIGKVTPGIIISLLMAFTVTTIGHFVYGVPIRGSILLMVVSLIVYVLAVIGIGVFISAFANTQQQASLGMFVSMMPIVALSGLMSPVESVTNPLVKMFIKCNPLVYANRLVRGIMLKNMTIHDALVNIYPLLIIAFVLLTISSYVFAKTHRLKIL